MLYEQSADKIFTNGNVLTLNKSNETASTIIVKNGKIITIGSDDIVPKWLGQDTELIDLDGKTIMPSFIESHMHPIILGQNMIEIDCRPSAIESIDQILEKVKAAVRQQPENTWIRGYGWNDSRIAEGRAPTREELDQVAPNHPVFLKRTCNHVAVVNSCALKLSNVTDATLDPQGGTFVRDENNVMTGLVQEQALNLIQLPSYDLNDIKTGFNIAQKYLLSLGITTVHEMAATTHEMTAYQSLIEDGQLKIRVRPWLLALDFGGMQGMIDSILDVGIRSNLGNDWLKIQGVKFFLDGAGSGGTARVYEQNLSDGKHGIIYYTLEEYAPHIQRCVEAGLRIAVHAIGDEAIDLAINGFSAMKNDALNRKMRHRIEHCALPTHEQLQRMKNLELIAASSVGFIYHVGDNYLYHYGQERMKRLYPQKSFKDFGIVAPANSDSPVVSANPFQGIYGAVTRKTYQGTVLDTEQNIDVIDALKAYTTDAAYSSFEEDSLGVIQVGAKADLIILSDNPLTVEHEQLKDISVLETYVDGQRLYKKQ